MWRDPGRGETQRRSGCRKREAMPALGPLGPGSWTLQKQKMHNCISCMAARQGFSETRFRIARPALLCPTPGVSPAMLTGIKSQVRGCIIRDQQGREAWRGHSRAKVGDEASRQVRTGWRVGGRLNVQSIPRQNQGTSSSTYLPTGSSPSGCARTAGNDGLRSSCPGPWLCPTKNSSAGSSVTHPTVPQPNPFGPVATDTSWVSLGK